jgi:hypothetical protein
VLQMSCSCARLRLLCFGPTLGFLEFLELSPIRATALFLLPCAPPCFLLPAQASSVLCCRYGCEI